MAFMGRPRVRFRAAVLGTDDPGRLARFYSELLGWPVAEDQGEWVVLRDPGGGTGLSFQYEPHHTPPVWPPEPGKQQMMIHLDIGVDDLEAGVELALTAGARLAEHQPQDDVRVLVDPAGHLFCLFALSFD